MADLYIFDRLISPLAVLLGALIMGLLVERATRSALRAATPLDRQGDGRLERAIPRGTIAGMFILGGLSLALALAEVSPTALTVARQVILSGVIFLAMIALGRLSGAAIELYAFGIPGLQPSTSIFVHIVQAAIYTIGTLVVLAIFHVPITPMLTALGVGGLGVALALRETLSNLFAGVQLLASKQIAVGDYVELESGQEGYVHDITWRNTTFRSLSNNMVIVPNSNLASKIITNVSRPEQRIDMKIRVGVAYGADLELVQRISEATAAAVVAETTSNGADFTPAARFQAFGENSVILSVSLRADGFNDQAAVRHELIKRLYSALREEGIELNCPASV